MNWERVAGRLQQSMAQELADTVARYEGKLVMLVENHEVELEQLRAQLEEKNVSEKDKDAR